MPTLLTPDRISLLQRHFRRAVTAHVRRRWPVAAAAAAGEAVVGACCTSGARAAAGGGGLEVGDLVGFSRHGVGFFWGGLGF